MEGSGSQIYNAFLERFRSGQILESINSGEDGPLPFTRAFEYVRNQDVPQDVRITGYTGIVAALEEFCIENNEKIYPLYRGLIRKAIECARTDIEHSNIEDAKSDLYLIERSYLIHLQDELSRIQAPDVRNYLRKNIIQAELDLSGMGGYVELQESC